MKDIFKYVCSATDHYIYKYVSDGQFSSVNVFEEKL